MYSSVGHRLQSERLWHGSYVQQRFYTFRGAKKPVPYPRTTALGSWRCVQLQTFLDEQPSHITYTRDIDNCTRVPKHQSIYWHWMSVERKVSSQGESTYRSILWESDRLRWDLLFRTTWIRGCMRSLWTSCFEWQWQDTVLRKEARALNQRGCWQLLLSTKAGRLMYLNRHIFPTLSTVIECSVVVLKAFCMRRVEVSGKATDTYLMLYDQKFHSDELDFSSSMSTRVWTTLISWTKLSEILYWSVMRLTTLFSDDYPGYALNVNAWLEATY